MSRSASGRGLLPRQRYLREVAAFCPAEYSERVCRPHPLGVRDHEPAHTIRTFADVETISEAAAREWVRLAAQAIAARGQFSVALSGGSTPKTLFGSLTREPYRRQMDWQRTWIFWGDERCVSPDDKDSNYRMAPKTMLDKLSIPPQHVFRMGAERSDLDQAAHDYQNALRGRWGLRLNRASHRSSTSHCKAWGRTVTRRRCSRIPPRCAKVRWVVPNAVPQLKTTRMTMTHPMLNRAARFCFSWPVRTKRSDW